MPEEKTVQQVADVSVVNVTKKFGDLVAVNNVSFDVPKGSFFSLLGPSGSGKSTLLRIIAGFEQPTAGDVYIRGQKVTHIPPNKRPINLVFQNLALFPMMNVERNVSFGLRCRKVPKAEIKRRVAEVLELVGLKGLEKRRIDQLSGGQQQRVAIARALVLNPTALALDEPLGALDRKLREKMKLVLKQLQRESGVTFIYVTHDQSEAMVMSDIIAVINHGRIEHIGSPTEVYYRPKTRFVAGFVGDANVWRGIVKKVEGDKCEVEIGKGLSITARVGEALSVGDEVDVFIRPEVIELGADVEGTSFEAFVDELIFDGAYTHVMLKADVDGKSLPLEAYLKQMQISDLKVGDRVRLSIGKTGMGVVAFRALEGEGTHEAV